MPDENAVKLSINGGMFVFERFISLGVLLLSICFYLHK